jgi:hypothetical protein
LDCVVDADRCITSPVHTARVELATTGVAGGGGLLIYTLLTGTVVHPPVIVTAILLYTAAVRPDITKLPDAVEV